MNNGIGLIGGAFNPIHFGHLRIAEEIADQLELEQIRFVPTGRPAHRAAADVDAHHRLAMVKLAIAGNPRFFADNRELEAEEISYTVDTVCNLQNELGLDRNITLIIGSDQLQALNHWSRWKILCDKVAVAVAVRPGYSIPDMRGLDSELAELLSEKLTTGVPQRGQIQLVPVTSLDISSTAIRQRLRDGFSVRYLLPERVLDYIREHHLYLDHHAN